MNGGVQIEPDLPPFRPVEVPVQFLSQRIAAADVQHGLIGGCRRMRAGHRVGYRTLLSRASNHPHIDRFQRIVGNGRDAKRPVAVWACHATLKKSALIKHIKPVVDMRRQTHRKSRQRKVLSPRAAEFPHRLPRASPAR